MCALLRMVNFSIASGCQDRRIQGAIHAIVDTDMSRKWPAIDFEALTCTRLEMEIELRICILFQMCSVPVLNVYQRALDLKSMYTDSPGNDWSLVHNSYTQVLSPLPRTDWTDITNPMRKVPSHPVVFQYNNFTNNPYASENIKQNVSLALPGNINLPSNSV